MSTKDVQDLVSTSIHAIPFQQMLEDVADYHQISEQNAEILHQQEARDISGANFHSAPPGYREHLLRNIDFRFQVSLPIRLRYSAVIALATSVEWAVKMLSRSAIVPVIPQDNHSNRTVQVLRALSRCSGAVIESGIDDFEALVHVRNCIAHDSGLIESYRYPNDLRLAVSRLSPGVILNNANLMGEQVWIEKGAIERLVISSKQMVVPLYIAMHEKNLLQSAAHLHH